MKRSTPLITLLTTILILFILVYAFGQDARGLKSVKRVKINAVKGNVGKSVPQRTSPNKMGELRCTHFTALLS